MQPFFGVLTESLSCRQMYNIGEALDCIKTGQGHPGVTPMQRQQRLEYRPRSTPSSGGQVA